MARRRWGLAAALLVCGCGAIQARLETVPEVVDARRVLDSLAAGDVVSVAARMDPSLGDVHATVVQLAHLFPAGVPKKVQVVGFVQNKVVHAGVGTNIASGVTFQSTYGSAVLVTELDLQAIDNGERHVVGLHVQPVPAPLEELNAFTFRGKGARHHLFLVAMVAVALTTLASVVTWVRRRHTTRKRWWWLAAILVGTFPFSLNWTTGALGFRVLTVQLLSLAAARPGFVGPWTLIVAIPSGAIAFLVVTWRQSRATRSPTAAPLS
ncbi:MAG TPA: hypothetical protein VHJ20_02495 [Polyangia bacterium]|nr:hypothetical protein [Polyangia bacterium]